MFDSTTVNHLVPLAGSSMVVVRLGGHGCHLLPTGNILQPVPTNVYRWMISAYDMRKGASIDCLPDCGRSATYQAGFNYEEKVAASSRCA